MKRLSWLLPILASLHLAVADRANDLLEKKIPGGGEYQNFTEAVAKIEEKTGLKVSYPPEFGEFMQTVWLFHQGEGGPSLPKETIRECLDGICRDLAVRWSLDPGNWVVTLDPAWNTSDPRTSAEIFADLQKHYSDGEKCRANLNALLTKPENYPLGWKVRQRAAMEAFFALDRSHPLLMQAIAAADGHKYTLLLIDHPIFMFPGSGSASYYWFKEDGILAGAGMMDTGHRCLLVDATIDPQYGWHRDQPSEVQMILKFNASFYRIARFILEAEGLKLRSLADARGEPIDNEGLHVGRSLIIPEAKKAAK